jgi:hypothetical protein
MKLFIDIGHVNIDMVYRFRVFNAGVCKSWLLYVLQTFILKHNIYSVAPVTVAECSKVWTVFARSHAMIVGSNPT